jgi:glutamyl-Q tRNA(Asp) synthetase
MEDLDRARLVRGCAEDMLRTLADFGLTWDGPVEYQSARTAHYAQALQQLAASGLIFQCSCSRRERADECGYPGTCRAGPRRPGPTATRFRVPDIPTSFEDRAQGHCTYSLRARGDVIIRRRDGDYAYQLAVVVDDALQGITDVVRGGDLLDSTPWQLALQQALGLPTPAYLHLPLVTEPDGKKLSKSMRSVAADPAQGGPQLHAALVLLRQQPPAALAREPARTVLEWACAHWRPEQFQRVRQVSAGAAAGGGALGSRC